MRVGPLLVSSYFAVLHGLIAAIVGFGVFAGLPNRWWVVDLPAGVMVAALIASVAALLLRFPKWDWVVRGTCYLLLGLGLVFVAVLSSVATYLWTSHGYVGAGGALVYFLVIALAVPYLVLFPLGQLLWLGA